MRSIFSFSNDSFENLDDSYIFIGKINSFNNILQSKADQFFDEISWKQVFILGCISLHHEPPTIRDLANLAGSTHQNVTQILSKLEKNNFISFQTDEFDRRKQRVILTEKARDFLKNQNDAVDILMKQIFSNIDSSELKTALRVISQLTENVSSFEKKF